MGMSNKSQVIITTLALAVVLWSWAHNSAAARTIPNIPDTSAQVDMHERWMSLHGITYEDAAEKARRREIFHQNVAKIEAFNEANKGVKSYWLGVNKFADMTNEEFVAARNGFKAHVCEARRAAASGGFRYENVSGVPESVDWRKKGAVTPVKDQSQCGCCWAFSAVAATEGITKLSTGKLISLSEQELVDCDTKGEDQGCNGGLMDDAFDFIKSHGLATEGSYPYQGADATCNAKEESRPAAHITGHEDVPANSETALRKAVAHQPVSVAIDAGGFEFQFYSGGVFAAEDCGTSLDHGVTAVGYGKTGDGTKYWLVKNSWGEQWGEEGYIRMERDVVAKEGLCGIAMMASYPTA